MLKQAENKVKIEGILNEINLEYGSYTKDGKPVECISGSINIKVDQIINGEEVTCEVPVHMFSNKYKTDGSLNPAFTSIEKVKTSYVSAAAAAGTETEPDRVRITSADIRMNEYYSSADKLVSFPRINASFVNRIKKEECKPEATFELTFVVGQADFEVVNDENTGRYRVQAIVPQYGGRVDIIPLIGASKGVVSAISTYWQEGETVKATGRLNFSSKTETITIEQDFGEPIERTRTTNVSELLITGGSQTPLDEEYSYKTEDIRQAIAKRRDRLEAQKEKDLARAKSRKASISTASSSNKPAFDLGF